MLAESGAYGMGRRFILQAIFEAVIKYTFLQYLNLNI